MRKFITAALFLQLVLTGMAQQERFTVIKDNPVTAVKNQAVTGTCWCFSAISMLEGECLRKTQKEVNVSEMYVVRNIYIEKAKNYLLRQGKAQFSEGALGHDAIRATAVYGAVPEEAFTGMGAGQYNHDHSKLTPRLKSYLDSLLKIIPLPANWLDGFKQILDPGLGGYPFINENSNFQYQGKSYTPKTFARDVLGFNENNYAYFTSFSHHPFNSQFVVEVPDNFSNGVYYNVPVDELLKITENAVMKGYAVTWDADVSNNGWGMGGYGLYLADSAKPAKPVDFDMEEKMWSQEGRQQLYERLETQDDHLMHITGIVKTDKGKKLFKVKNSWSEKAGPFNGYWYISEAYFAINTITVVVPKAALDLKTSVKYKISNL